MKTSTYNSWWREMGAISRGLMFIEGSIATLDRTERDTQPAPASEPSQPRDIRPAKRGKKNFSLLEDLRFLGGRPMTAGHNYDIDEPFPQSLAGEPQRPGGQRNRPSQTCATC